MNIRNNEIERSIEIEDGLKSQYLNLKILMVVLLINSIINLVRSIKTGEDILSLVWIVFSSIAIVYFYTLRFKKSTLEKIPVKDIIKLRDKSIFGRKRYSLELSNGKRRDLIQIKKPAEIKELRKLLSDAGFIIEM